MSHHIEKNYTPKSAVVEMKKIPAEEGENVSEFLRWELCTVLEKKRGWSYINTRYDDYTGYVRSSQLVRASEKNLVEAMQFHPNQQIPRVALQILMDSYMQTPYLRAGRTAAGIDCSGLMQAIGKHFGYSILRDSYQQATQGEEVKFLEESRVGDFAFFGTLENWVQRITHVGMILEDGKIYHSSTVNKGVAIDTLTDAGIINTKSGEKTHDLLCIRRVLNVTV